MADATAEGGQVAQWRTHSDLNWKDHVLIDKRYFRSTQVNNLRIANEIHISATRKNKEWQDKLPTVVIKVNELSQDLSKGTLLCPTFKMLSWTSNQNPCQVCLLLFLIWWLIFACAYSRRIKYDMFKIDFLFLEPAVNMV